jgi:hypothetical protein
VPRATESISPRLLAAASSSAANYYADSSLVALLAGSAASWYCNLLSRKSLDFFATLSV